MIKVGDLVEKVKGVNKGQTGVVTRVYNENNSGFLILEVLINQGFVKWSASWVEVRSENE